MPENIGYQFNRLYAAPIETYRQVNTITNRNAIPPEIRWEGMECYVVTENQDYQLVGGVDNSNWVNAGETVSNPPTHFKGFFNATTVTPAISNLNGIEGDEYKVTNGGVNVDFGAGNIFLETDDILIFYQSEWRVKVRASDNMYVEKAGDVMTGSLQSPLLIAGAGTGGDSAPLRIIGTGVGTSSFGQLMIYESDGVTLQAYIGKASGTNGHIYIGSSISGKALTLESTGSMNYNGTIRATPATLSTELVTKGQLDAAARPYKVYAALLSQSGTSAPTVIVLENTLGGTVVWSRASAGEYLATLSGAFTTNKTLCFFQKSTQTGSSSPFTYSFSAPVSGTNVVDLETQLAGAYADGLIERCSIEIRVYN